MKTKLLLTIAFVLGLSYHHWAQQASITTNPEPKYPYVEVIVTQEKVWLMPDEQPVSNVPVQVTDASGEVVLQFSAPKPKNGRSTCRLSLRVNIKF